MKATHYGECQLCGRKQRLPNSVLAKHGYAVQWNTFQGVCPGSGHAPYELSRDLLEVQAVLQEARLIEQRAQATEARSLRDAVWVREYIPATFGVRHSSGVWHRLPLSEVTIEHGTVVWTANNGKRHVERTYGGGDIVVALNARRAEAFAHDAEKTLQYIKWLRARRTAWKLKTLTPV